MLQLSGNPISRFSTGCFRGLNGLSVMSLAYVSSDEVCVKVTRGHRRVRTYWMRQ